MKMIRKMFENFWKTHSKPQFRCNSYCKQASHVMSNQILLTFHQDNMSWQTCGKNELMISKIDGYFFKTILQSIQSMYFKRHIF